MPPDSKSQEKETQDPRGTECGLTCWVMGKCRCLVTVSHKTATVAYVPHTACHNHNWQLAQSAWVCEYNQLPEESKSERNTPPKQGHSRCPCASVASWTSDWCSRKLQPKERDKERERKKAHRGTNFNSHKKAHRSKRPWGKAEKQEVTQIKELAFHSKRNKRSHQS